MPASPQRSVPVWRWVSLSGSWRKPPETLEGRGLPRPRVHSALSPKHKPRASVRLAADAPGSLMSGVAFTSFRACAWKYVWGSPGGSPCH